MRPARLWSDLPSGGKGMAAYASLTFAYNRSIVLFPLVEQSTYWKKADREESSVTSVSPNSGAKQTTGQLKKKKSILELICAYSGGEIYWANANLRQRHLSTMGL